MAEAKRQRMKVESRCTLAAVLLVAYHWMARLGKMDANLVLATGLELHLDERSAVGRGKPPPLGPRELAYAGLRVFGDPNRPYSISIAIFAEVDLTL